MPLGGLHSKATNSGLILCIRPRNFRHFPSTKYSNTRCRLIHSTTTLRQAAPPAIVSDSINEGVKPVRWFYATDRPLKKPNILGWMPNATPEKFSPFSDRDSSRLEEAYQKQQQKGAQRVAVLEDRLFEVDLESRSLLPVYWEGPIFEVRRGTWFVTDVSSKQTPCPERLAEELETLYYEDSQRSATEREKPIVYDLETKLNYNTIVQAPYKNNSKENEDGDSTEKYVVRFDPGKRAALIISNDLTSNVLQKLVALGGTRLTRGFDCKREKKDTPTTETNAETAHKETAAMINKDRNAAKRHVVSDASLPAQNPEESDSRPVDHLVICIHGIGQKLGQRIESISFVQDINVFRKLLKEVFVQSEELQESAKQYVIEKHRARSKLAKSQMAEYVESPKAKAEFSTNHGVQVIPLIWRHDIKFGMTRKDIEMNFPSKAGITPEVSLDDITVDGIGSLRSVIADVVLDVLLYYQPAYHAQIIDATTKQLNRLYRKFCERNPEFAKNPRVSIVGHSLGSAIGFDIVCAQETSHSAGTKHKLKRKGSTHEQNHENKPQEKQLDFDVDLFIGVGSPVGIFQMLKGNHIVSRHSLDTGKTTPTSTGGPTNTLSPKVLDYYNLFHPSDPVAYRVDPLVHRDATSLPPILVPYATGSFPSQIQALQTFSLKFASEASNMWNSASTFFPSLIGNNGWSSSNAAANDESTGGADSGNKTAQGVANKDTRHLDAKKKSLKNAIKDVSKQEEEDMAKYKKSLFEELPENVQVTVREKLLQLNQSGQIDHALQVGPLDISLVAALASHVSYFESADVANFLLQSIYKARRSEKK